jgi:hypothetical protein
MAYIAKDGRHFTHPLQGRTYDKSLAEEGHDQTKDAPGGPQHEEAVRAHGLASKIIIERGESVGNGRTRLTAIHADGFKHTSVHPEAYRAHDLGRELLGIEAPPALQTHSRARSQPRGPKEDERVAQEDSREVEEPI